PGRRPGAWRGPTAGAADGRRPNSGRAGPRGHRRRARTHPIRGPRAPHTVGSREYRDLQGRNGVMTTPRVMVNGEQRPVVNVEPHVTALDWLCDQGLTGAKEGC